MVGVPSSSDIRLLGFRFFDLGNLGIASGFGKVAVDHDRSEPAREGDLFLWREDPAVDEDDAALKDSGANGVNLIITCACYINPFD